MGQEDQKRTLESTETSHVRKSDVQSYKDTKDAQD